MARPFPWDALPSWSEDDASRLGAASALLGRVSTALVARAASSVLGLPCRITSLDLTPGRFEPVPLTNVRLRVPGGVVTLFPEAALVRRAVEAVLSRAPRAPLHGASPPAEVEAAFVAIVAATARRCGLVPFVTPAPPRARLGVLHRAVVELGDEVFELRALIEPEDALRFPARRGIVASLGEVPIGLETVAATLAVSRAEVRGLVPGALLVDEQRKGLTRAARGWTGRAALAAARSEVALVVELGPDAQLVLTGPRSLPWDLPAMTDPDHDRALADADVVVRVEVGTLTLPAATWAALRPGDVVATDVRIGDHAVLRAGGVVLARGELCDVDGHLAVRITERTTSP